MSRDASKRSGLPIVHEFAAGIDVGARFHVVAVPPHITTQPVLRIPAMADSSTGDGGQRRSVATQVGWLFIRLSGMLQGRPLFAHRLS
jgi:hypothetical protein